MRGAEPLVRWRQEVDALHAAIAARLEAAAPRPRGGADGARAAAAAPAQLQREASLAAALFAAAGRRLPAGLRRAGAGPGAGADARFSVPVGRMGDYLEVRVRAQDMPYTQNPAHYMQALLRSRPARGALSGVRSAGGGAARAAAGPGPGRRRARAAQPLRVRQPVPARQARRPRRAGRARCGPRVLRGAPLAPRFAPGTPRCPPG